MFEVPVHQGKLSKPSRYNLMLGSLFQFFRTAAHASGPRASESAPSHAPRSASDVFVNHEPCPGRRVKRCGRRVTVRAIAKLVLRPPGIQCTFHRVRDVLRACPFRQFRRIAFAALVMLPRASWWNASQNLNDFAADADDGRCSGNYALPRRATDAR